MQKSVLNSCPCGWVGLCSEAAQNHCPKCHALVTSTSKKRLDRLRLEHTVLGKLGGRRDLSLQQKAAERQRIEDLFQCIGQPLRINTKGANHVPF